MKSKREVATVTSKGQVTIPAEIRRVLGIEPKDKLIFEVEDDGGLHVKKAKYPTIASIAGIAGPLPRPMSWDEMQEVVGNDVADRYIEKHVRDS